MRRSRLRRRAWSSCAPSSRSTSSCRRSIRSCRCWPPPATSWPRSGRRSPSRRPRSSRSPPTRWPPTSGSPPTASRPCARRRSTRSRADPGAWPFPLRRQAAVRERRRAASPSSAIRRSSRWRHATARSSCETLAAGAEHTIDVLVDRAGRVRLRRAAAPDRGARRRGGQGGHGPLADARTPRRRGVRGAARRRTARSRSRCSLDEQTDEVAIIELNARFGGGFPLSREAGADFPRWMLEELIGLPSTARADGWQRRRRDAALRRRRVRRDETRATSSDRRGPRRPAPGRPPHDRRLDALVPAASATAGRARRRRRGRRDQRAGTVGRGARARRRPPRRPAVVDAAAWDLRADVRAARRPLADPARRRRSTCSTPTTPSPASTAASSAGSPACRSSSTRTTGSTSATAAGSSAGPCSPSRASPPASPTPSWSRTPRTWRC